MPDIRPKIRIQHVQRAQGLVEFALVLPLLLLLILGVFAFGHLFFVYSSVVSASREAARWGAAVGESGNNAPRYEDCKAIRDQAVRLGAFAGVNGTDINDADPKDTGVDISYDHGPNADGTSSPYTTCPEIGPGPVDVQMGDRIIVRVKVNYTPIVPVVNLPSFPLEAVTYRTILKSVPVGEAPTAVDPCLVDLDIAVGPPSSVVGETVSYTGTVKVQAKDTSKYNGPVVGNLVITGAAADSLDGKVYTCTAPVTDGTFTCVDPTIAYLTAGDKQLQAEFKVTDQSSTCLQNSLAPFDFVHHVDAANTTTIVNAPSPVQAKVSMKATVTVQANAPGSGIPTGTVLLTWEDPLDAQTISVTLGSNGDAPGTASWIFAPKHPGMYAIRAQYQGDQNPNPNFMPSEGTKPDVVVYDGTATPSATSTPGVLPTPSPYCPTAGQLSFSNSSNTITVNVSNGQAAAEPVQLTAVDFTWNRIPNSPVTNITFGGSLLWPAPNTNNLPVLAPPHQVVDSRTKGWNGPGFTLAVNGSGQLVITLGGALPSGATNKYILGLTFTSTVKKGNPDCVLTIDGYNY